MLTVCTCLEQPRHCPEATRESCSRDRGRDASRITGLSKNRHIQVPFDLPPSNSGLHNMLPNLGTMTRRLRPPVKVHSLSMADWDLNPGPCDSWWPRHPEPQLASFNSLSPSGGHMPRCLTASAQKVALGLPGSAGRVLQIPFSVGSIPMCHLESLPSFPHQVPYGSLGRNF